MGTKDMSDPEHDSAPADGTPKAPRTDIKDLPAPDELTQEEAEQVAGGLVVNQIIATQVAGPLSPQKLTSMRAFTTGGNPYPDQDTVNDRE
jgi:hypothetical protein